MRKFAKKIEEGVDWTSSIFGYKKIKNQHGEWIFGVSFSPIKRILFRIRIEFLASPHRGDRKPTELNIQTNLFFYKKP